MKKVLSLVVAALFVSSSAFAASVNFTATATFAGAASFSFQLKNISNDQNATNLVWSSADAFNMSEDIAWVRADQYAVVTADITKAGANVYMYTQNKIDKPSLEPNYTDWNGTQGVAGTESYGGLVRTAGKGTANGGAYRGYIPVMFSYNTTKNSSITSNGTEVIEKNGTGANAPVLRADRYLSDKSNGEYDEDYTIIASLNGPTFGVDATTGAWSGACTDNTAYMYFFGGFKDVIGGDTYTTTVHVVEDFE